MSATKATQAVKPIQALKPTQALKPRQLSIQEYTGDQVAAVVPIAGDGTTALAAVGCELAEVGIWAFHGEDDTTVNVNGTIQTIDGLAGCPSPPAQEVIQTIYEGVGHNSWDATYDGSAGFDIFEWFLRFKSPN